MSTQNDEHQGTVLMLLVGVILFVLLFVFSLVLSRSGPKTATPTAAATTAPATGTTAVSANDAAQVVVQDGVVKFYFASGKADLAGGAAQALAVIVEGVGHGKMAVVSGFHDNTGGQQLNEELAKQRALAVRDALQALGVPQEKIELRKPQDPAPGGDAAEARRVEVMLR